MWHIFNIKDKNKSTLNCTQFSLIHSLLTRRLIILETNLSESKECQELWYVHIGHDLNSDIVPILQSQKYKNSVWGVKHGQFLFMSHEIRSCCRSLNSIQWSSTSYINITIKFVNSKLQLVLSSAPSAQGEYWKTWQWSKICNMTAKQQFCSLMSTLILNLNMITAIHYILAKFKETNPFMKNNYALTCTGLRITLQKCETNTKKQNKKYIYSDTSVIGKTVPLYKTINRNGWSYKSHNA